MTTILILSLVGAIISAIIGTFWYSPLTPMGRLHMKTIGFDKLSPEEQKKSMEEMKPKMWKYYLAQIVLAFIMSFFVVYVVLTSVQNGTTFSQALWFPIMNWLGYMVPAFGTAILWGNIDRNLAWKEFFSNILSHLVTIVVIAFVTSFFV